MSGKGKRRRDMVGLGKRGEEEFMLQQSKSSLDETQREEGRGKARQ